MRKRWLFLAAALLIFTPLLGLWVSCKATLTIHDMSREEVRQSIILQSNGKKLHPAMQITLDRAKTIKLPEERTIVLCGEGKKAKEVYKTLKKRGFTVTTPCTLSEFLRAAYPSITEVRLRGRGAGDRVERVVSKVSGGQGKEMADALAKAVGKKGCGCQRRKDALNERSLSRRRGK